MAAGQTPISKRNIIKNSGVTGQLQKYPAVTG
jgi:hypothetical protein